MFLAVLFYCGNNINWNLSHWLIFNQWEWIAPKGAWIDNKCCHGHQRLQFVFVPYDGTPLIGRFAISSTFQSCYRTLGVSLKSSLRSNRIEFLRNSLLFKLARRVCSIMFATQTIHETEGFNSCRRQFMTVLPSIHCLLNSKLFHYKDETKCRF